MPGILKTFSTDPVFDGGFMFGTYDANLSAEQVTLAATTIDLPAGTVLGKVTATGVYKPLDPAANDGAQNFAGLLFGRREVSTGVQRATALVRRQGVNANLITYINAVTDNQRAAIVAQASAAGIIFRS